MNKYIIKNCPCYESEGVFYNCVNERIEGDCQDCTNCVLKQIVKLCREELNSLETYVDIRSLECTTLQNILKLLDLQEISDE